MELNKELREKWDYPNGFITLEYDFKSLGDDGRTLKFKVPKQENYSANEIIALTNMIFEAFDKIFSKEIEERTK